MSISPGSTSKGESEREDELGWRAASAASRSAMRRSEFAGFEQPGGDAGGPEYGVGAGDGGLHAEEIEGDGLDGRAGWRRRSGGRRGGRRRPRWSSRGGAGFRRGVWRWQPPVRDRDGGSSRTAHRAWGWRGR